MTLSPACLSPYDRCLAFAQPARLIWELLHRVGGIGIQGRGLKAAQAFMASTPVGRVRARIHCDAGVSMIELNLKLLLGERL